MVDYVIYEDTDSLFLNIGRFIEDQGLKDKWKLMDEKTRIQYIIKISEVITKYVNKQIFEQTQKFDMNSQEKEYKINFKQEIVAKSGIFIAKKKYALWNLDEEGSPPKENLKVTGLEIIRSDTPEEIKDMLKDVLSRILLNEPDKDISKRIQFYKKEIKNLIPEHIATNISCNNTKKFIKKDYSTIKGTPMHIKGVAAYRFLLNKMGLKNKYPDINDSEKAKCVYISPNKYQIEQITFLRWPKEFFEKGLFVDYDKMIDKYFVNKIKMFLTPINKEHLLNANQSLIEELFF